MLKLLSSRLQRGAAQKGFVQVALHVVGQTRKVSLSMGIPVDVIFVTCFLSNHQFFFQQNCCISRMVKLRGDLKNKKPCITMTKESVTGLISITKTLSIPCCSTLFSRFLCHHFTTVKYCQTSSECRCDHGFSLQEHLRILASSIACYLRLSVCQKYPWRGIVGHKLYMFTIDFNHAKLKLQKDSLW